MVYEESGSSDIVLEAAEQKIYALRQGRNVGGLLPMSAVINSVFDDLSAAAASGSRIPGLSTGLPDLDRVILGLNKSDLILIAARPGMGKTSIVLNIALHVAMSLKKTVAIFSLEMSREQLAIRMLSKAALVPLHNLLTGQLNENQWQEIARAAQVMSNCDIRIDDNASLTVSDMNAACRRVPNLGLVCIDYLQLMQSAGHQNSYSNENRVQIVSEISRMLKVMAKELNVPVICASQLNRGVESRQEKRPLLSDLRESGSIEQDADAVIALYRDGYYNRESETPNLAEALVLKNRRGSTGSVYLNWLADYTSFTSYEGNREEDY
jgi:replicative DNA helicase